MPFRHVVMFRWAAHVDAEHVHRVRDGLDALPAAIPEIRRYVHGSDVGVSEGNFDYVVVADFDTVNDWRTYRDHTTHVLLIEELIKGHVTDRAAVQHQTPDGSAPDVAGTGVSTAAHVPVPGQPSDTEAADESDDELLERARKAAAAEMQALLAEPDDR